MNQDIYGNNKTAKIFWIIGLYSILIIIYGFFRGIFGHGWLIFFMGLIISSVSIYTSYHLAGGKNNPAIYKRK